MHGEVIEKAAILNRLVRMGIIEKRAFEQRFLEERKELSLRKCRKKHLGERQPSVQRPLVKVFLEFKLQGIQSIWKETRVVIGKLRGKR